jgi:tetratricopeptide (TPR) repeat protein
MTRLAICALTALCVFAASTPQAKSPEELDRFGQIAESSNPLQTIRLAESFLADYATSQFTELALQLELEAFWKRDDVAAIRRCADRVLTLNPENQVALVLLAASIANRGPWSALDEADEYAARALKSKAPAARTPALADSDYRRWRLDLRATAEAARATVALRHGEAVAVDRWKRVIALRASPAGSDFFRLGDASLMNADASAAEKAYQRAAELGPATITELVSARLRWKQLSSQQLFQTARNLEASAHLTDAVAAYLLLLAREPQLPEVHHNLGLAYYRLHEYPLAGQQFRKALELNNQLTAPRLFLGLSLFQLDHFEESANQLSTFLVSDPGNREAHLFRLRDRMALDSFNEEELQQAIQAAPADPELNYIAGQACLQQIRVLSRQANVEGKHSPDFLWLHLRQSDQRGEAEAAAKFRDELHRVGSDSPPPLVQTYDRVAALVARSFDAVLAASPDSRYAHGVRGYLHESANRVDESLAEYRAVEEHYAAGRLLAQNGRHDEAARAFQQELDLNPRNHRAMADLARTYIQTADYPHAAPLLLKLVNLYPSDADAWSDLAKLQEKEGNMAQAADSLGKALAIDNTQGPLHYRLATVYRKLGRADDAARELTEFSKYSRNASSPSVEGQ